MNKNKADRKIKVTNGWTKGAHKGLKIYYKDDYPDNTVGSLKKKKGCKFNKGIHIFELVKQGELDWWKEMWSQYKCSSCGKLKHVHEIKK